VTALKINRLLSPETSTSTRSYIDEVELEVDEIRPLEQFPEERLFYFIYGRGIMSIYEESPNGDVYEIRQDTAVWITPMIKHQLINTGNYPLKYIVLMTTGGLAPGGDLSWSAISQRGVVVDKPQVGSGQATTRVFDEGLNPSSQEGLHLRIRDINLRRPQKFSNAEAVTISPGRSTRPHTHHDSEENYYILVGKGNFIWNDKKIACDAGSCISFPIGVTRRVENTGDYPLTYICFSAFID
jgi:mannose-6-phosphate isomerase-like protein (cupin superfamily)